MMRIGKHSKIEFVDCMKGMDSLKDESVALTFTSPPYWNYIQYPDGGVGNDEDTYFEYIERLKNIIRAVYRKTIHGGTIRDKRVQHEVQEGCRRRCFCSSLGVRCHNCPPSLSGSCCMMRWCGTRAYPAHTRWVASLCLVLTPIRRHLRWLMPSSRTFWCL